jgi:hypothetical protein
MELSISVLPPQLKGKVIKFYAACTESRLTKHEIQYQP